MLGPLMNGTCCPDLERRGNYLNVEERDHKSASEKDSKPSFKFVQQNDLLEK